MIARLILALALVIIPARAFSSPAPATVSDISGPKYFPSVRSALASARKSIKLVMFTIEASAYRDKSKVNQLVDTLIEAKNRGVDVEVVLDQNIDFVQRRHAGGWETVI